MNRHRVIDARSLAFGRAIAARVKENPDFVGRARATVARWMKTCSMGTRPALEEWREALDGPISGVLSLLTGDDERAVRLRQSNPFTGVLPAAERNRIIMQFQSNDSART